MYKTTLVILATLLAVAMLFASGKPAPSVTSISIDVNPVSVGSPANVTVTVSPAPAERGMLQVQEAVDDTGAVTSCELAVDFESVAFESPATNGTLTAAADTSVAGTFGYRGHFVPAGSHEGQSKSDCVDLVVQ